MDQEAKYFSIDPGFQPLPFDDNQVREMVLPLFVISEGKFEHVGTGFAIHPNGLVLTATHVVNYAKRLNRGFAPNLHAMYVSAEPNPAHPGCCIGGLLRVISFSSFDAFDISLCCLSMPVNVHTGEELTLPVATLSIEPPAVGEKVLAVGYYNAESSPPRIDADAQASVVDYSLQSTCTSGHITEVHQVRRDFGMLKWPCFLTTARSKHGLSGSPIFREAGSVCGVVCSGALPDDDGNFPFYGSLIWPSLALPVKMIDNSGQERMYRVAELVDAALMRIDGDVSRISIREDSNGDYGLGFRDLVQELHARPTYEWLHSGGDE